MSNDDKDLDKDQQNNLSDEALEEQMFNEFADGTAGGDSPDDDQPRDDQGRFVQKDEDLDDDPDDDPEKDDPEGELDDPNGGQEGSDLSELDKAKQEIESWKHRYNSDLGRQNALQRKIQELQAENAQLAQQRQSHSGSGDNPSDMSDEKWKAFKDDFPEFAEMMELRDKQHKAEIQSLREQFGSQLEPIQQNAKKQYQDSQVKLIEQQHSDWLDVVQTPEFGDWLQNQPRQVQDLINSDDAPDVAYLLDNFKAQTAQQSNDRLTERRKRNLEQSRTIPNRGNRQRTAISDDDEDALFDYYADR